MSKNILITGGAGFIGTNLALKLLKNGYSITILDNISKQVHGSNFNLTSSFKTVIEFTYFIKGDVRNREDWVKALENQDIVIHFAAETGTGQSMYEVEKYVDVNIRGTAILLDCLVNGNHNVKKLILASSRAIYGEGKYYCREHGNVYPKGRREIDLLNSDFEVKCPVCKNHIDLLPIDEDSSINPLSIYGITKQTQEQIVKTTCNSIGIPSIVFRYQNVYGPGQSLSNPYTGILPIFSTRILNENPINLFEDGRQSRDFVYVDDVVDATILGIEKNEANNEVFNVGSGERISVLNVAETLQKKYGLETEINMTGNFRLGDIRHSWADLSKIRTKLGFEPRYRFDEGITKFIEWVQSQKVQSDRYDYSIEKLSQKGIFK